MRDERLPRAYGMVPVRLLLQRRFKEPSSLGIVPDNLLKLKPMVLRRKVRKITKSSSFNGNKKYAPEPPGAWPIIGHLPLLVSAKQPHRAFAALADKLSQPLGKLMAYDHSVMGFTPFGTYWREIRKIATVELFSARRIGMLKPVRRSEVSLWMKGLHDKWVHNGNTSVSVELKTQLEELTFNLLTQMVAESVTTEAIQPRNAAKAQIELDTNVGKDRTSRRVDIPNLKYLQALLKETLRMYPVGPLLVPHEAMEDCHVAGYFVPRGTAYSSMHGPYNVTQMSGPSRTDFCLERFLTTNADMDVRAELRAVAIWVRRRSCPGVGLALQVMHLTLARILQAFELKTLSNVGVDLEECSGILLSMMHSLQVLMAPRLPSELYD
ncbi:hypothetical protein Syun_031462 [Stephania yunnanensis]|uniref:Cytochrome P450 n=1 Tax=Stephania yunnanensis TaxID=152371 RepID=A0AAP0HBE4_9MAGN